MKINHFTFLLLLMLSAQIQYAQISFPKTQLKNLTNKALTNYKINENNVLNGPDKEMLGGRLVDFFKARQRVTDMNFEAITHRAGKSSDTLIIGAVPGDSLYITGNYFHDGPIIVLNGGKLVIENANALINGDLYVWGSGAKVWIYNSVVQFPQSYIYQRTIGAVGGGVLEIHQSTLDYSGLSHNLIINDSSKVIWRDVHKLGFTTCGLNDRAEIDVDSTNQAGEFIMMDKVKLSFANANTILLWHYVPDSAGIDIAFPNGDTLATCSFDSSSVGVNNIYYSYSIDSCTNVMWGLMPEPGSNVRISNSDLRTIGVWFRNQPAYQVSGLVNNTFYANFVAPLSSHNIQLINTHVRTWSLYMFSNAKGNVDNCIVGEIGTMFNSSVTINNSMVDGSGGYLWAEDTSKVINGFSYLNSDFHTNDYSIGVIAYGGQNMGRCIAKNKSIMIVTQSDLTQEPELFNDALVFYLKLESASTIYSDSLSPIIGSAWIDKASNYYPIDFGWYHLDYKMIESDPWTPINDTVFSEVHSSVLCFWNTSALPQGAYTVRITMCDNSPDSNKVEAVKQFMIMPMITSVTHPHLLETTMIFPNPFSTSTTILFSKSMNNAELTIFSLFGQKVKTIKNISGREFKLHRDNLQSGLYFIQLIQDNKIIAVDKITIID